LDRRAFDAILDAMTTSELATHELNRVWKPRTVVVGFDGSPAAARALERALALMDSSGLLILVTVEPAVHSRGVLSESLLEQDDDLAVESLRQGRARLRDADVAQLVLLRRGNPTQALVDVARDYGAELLIVGRRGRDFAARALLGSVATQVVANAPCDVLVVS
jgi:nucleotide-binding universal stress UspA family protein